MQNQNSNRSMKNFASFVIGILLLPVLAACGTNETAQVPKTVTPPAADVTDVPQPITTTPATTPGAVINRDIKDVIEASPSLTTLANLIGEADLENKLDNIGTYTLFAPSDQAFAALPEVTRQRLLQPENRELLRQVLAYHVVSGNLTTNQLQSKEVNTLNNNPVNIQVDQTSNQVRVNDARVIQPDIQTKNGVIHIIDRVILPPMIQ
ncbi:MAG: fasciclin domain-containing protein [Goleter apudmare HA4340-LM2]|nr:fasciclin domain-containing protein [Goleter apudmare HA4340-LM2]